MKQAIFLTAKRNAAGTSFQFNVYSSALSRSAIGGINLFTGLSFSAALVSLCAALISEERAAISASAASVSVASFSCNNLTAFNSKSPASFKDLVESKSSFPAKSFFDAAGFLCLFFTVLFFRKKIYINLNCFGREHARDQKASLQVKIQFQNR